MKSYKWYYVAIVVRIMAMVHAIVNVQSKSIYYQGAPLRYTVYHKGLTISYAITVHIHQFRRPLTTLVKRKV